MLSASLMPAANQAARARRLRIRRANCLCPRAHIAVTERKATSTIAERTSPDAPLKEIACSNIQAWIRQSGLRLPDEPKPSINIMDKSPSVEVLSRCIAATCCQHAVSSSEAAAKKEICHATRRPAVSNHSGAPAHRKTAYRGCDRGRAGDLEAHDLPRHRDPDRTARADPRRSRHGLHPGEGI